MTERLAIQNFAGLNIDIELGRINIFIGPQASGKSVCIKCIAYFQSFADMLTSWASNGFSRRDFDLEFIDYFSSLFSANYEKDFTLRYNVGEYFIELSNLKNEIRLNYSSFYKELYSKLRNAYAHQAAPSFSKSELIMSPVLSPLIEETEQKIGPIKANRLFVPTNRAHYSLLRQTGRAPLAIIADDPMAAWFQGFYHFLKKQQNRRHYKEFPHRNGNKIVVGLINSILRATVVKEEKEDVVMHRNGARTTLRQASSGQQEALPLLLVLEYLAGTSSRDLPSVVFVEEPETHLHPEAQRAIVNLLATVYNISSQPLQIFLTTHTPYLLSAFNNLIYAGHLASNLKKSDSTGRKKLYATVPKELHMHLADFRVYGLENGEAQFLVDAETGLLRADTIDSVSDLIGDQFGALMDLDPTTKRSTPFE